MPSQKISPADRIRELSVINAEVASVLESAGKAVNSLTNRPLSTTTDADEDAQMTEGNDGNVDERKSAFLQHTEAYYTGLQSVVARLRRQAYALEEAGIISSEAPALSASSQPRQTAMANASGRQQITTASPHDGERITNGGLGNLDIGWLNSRGNKVGAEKESELIEEAKSLLEEALSRNGTAG